MTSLEQRLELRLNQFQSELENYGKIITSQNQIITSQDGIITTLRNESVSIRSELVTVESELKNYGKIITSQDEIISTLRNDNISLRSELTKVKTKLAATESKLTATESKLVTVESKLAQLEERFDLLDRNLSVIAPFIRAILCDQASILTDPDYFTELRDTEDESSFTPAVDILKAQPEFDDWSAKYDGQVKGLTIGFGQRLSAFYQNVTSNTPRKFERRFKYWLEAESVIVENVLRLFRAAI